MTSSTNPTWYDVLGVEPDATPEQIKAAWRNSTDRFEPGSGSGQFRLFNEAADVLLDPASRAAYDRSLGAPAGGTTVDLAKRPWPEVEDSGSAEAAPAPVTPVEGPDAAPVTGRKPRRERKQRPPRSARPPGEPATRGSVILAAALAVLTVAVLVAAGWFGLEVRENARVADARDQAPAAAERAAKAMLAYDYKNLPADRKRAEAFLSDDFAKDYLENFELLEKQKDGTPGAAVQSKTAVTAAVLGSGVMKAEAEVVEVLVYVNQTSTRPGRDPQIFQNRVAMTMEKAGNNWLVGDLKSY